jgi:hypothetical protein
MSVKLDVAENALAAALFIGISRTINIALVHINLIGFRRRVVGTPAKLFLRDRVRIVFRAKIFTESVRLVDTGVYFLHVS